MKKRDKRGQIEGSTFVGLLIALVVLVVVILGIYYFVQRGQSIGQNVPSDVEVIIQACNLVAGENFKDSYCNQIREIGKNKYVTCDYAADKEALTIKDSDIMKPICAGSSKVQRLNQQINDNNLKNDTLINGEKVRAWIGKLTNVSANTTASCISFSESDYDICYAIETETLCKANTKCEWK